MHRSEYDVANFATTKREKSKRWRTLLPKLRRLAARHIGVGIYFIVILLSQSREEEEEDWRSFILSAANVVWSLKLTTACSGREPNTGMVFKLKSN
jgi:hypothetical protein